MVYYSVEKNILEGNGMMILGLTGGSGTGKGVVGDLLCQLGASRIDTEITNIIHNAYAATKEKLSNHMDKLEMVANYLIEHEKMDGDTFKAMMQDTQETVWLLSQPAVY